MTERINYQHLGPARINTAPIAPWGIHPERAAIVAPYPDHGRPIFAGSTINQHPILVETADRLSPEQSDAINLEIGEEANAILDGSSRQTAVLSSRLKDRPELHLLTTITKSGQELFVYYIKREYMGAPVMYISAKGTIQDLSRIEGLFRSTGYTQKIGIARR